MFLSMAERLTTTKANKSRYEDRLYATAVPVHSSLINVRNLSIS